jgi:hypothetical protein
MDNTKTFPYIIGQSIGIAPQYEATNTFGDFQSDVAALEIYPNYNPQTQNGALVTFFPSGNDPTFGSTGGSPSHEAITDSIRQGALAWLTIPQKYKVYAHNSGCTTTGTWTAAPEFGGLYGLTSHTNGSTIACTITTYGQPIIVWYKLNGNDGGTFTYQLDSGTVSANVPTEGPSNNFSYPMTGNSLYTSCCSGVPFSVAEITIPATAGSHTVNFAVTSTTSGSNTFTPYGIGTPPPGGYDGGNPTVFIAGQNQPSTGSFYSAFATAYNTDIKNDVSTLAGYGLAVNFVDVRNNICCNATTDISGYALTSQGQKHVADVFGAAIQAQSNDALAINPKKYGAAANARLWTDNYGSPNHAINTTQGSNVISIDNYTVQPGAASCSGGGGDGGQVIVIHPGYGFASGPIGPPSYISAVTTSNNTLTLAPGWSAAFSDGGAFAVIEGCPSDPNNWATAHDDSAAVVAATVAAQGTQSSFPNASYLQAAGGGHVVLPTNIGIHNAQPASNVDIGGSMGGSDYVINLSAGIGPATIVYTMSAGYPFDPLYGFDMTNSVNVKMHDFAMRTPSYVYQYASGQTGSCIGSINGNGTGNAYYDINPEALYADHINTFGCNVTFGVPIGFNEPVTFTASIPSNSNQMTVTAITSSNFSTEWAGLPSPDWLGPRGFTGSGVPAGATIVAPVSGNAAAGGTGVYTISVTTTAAVSSETMTAGAASSLWTGTFIKNQSSNDGITFNGDFSDAHFTDNIITSVQYAAYHIGPETSGSGNGSNVLSLGRCEEGNLCVVCSTCGLEMLGGEGQFNPGPALVLQGNADDVDVTAFKFSGNCSSCASGHKAQIEVNATNSTLSVVHPTGYYAVGNTQYFVEVTTGSTGNQITVDGGGELHNTYSVAPVLLDGGVTLSAERISGTYVPTIDTTQPNGSWNAAGGFGIGTNSANAGMNLDLSQTTSSIGLPTGATASRPPVPVAGMLRYNSSTSLPEFYNTSWNPMYPLPPGSLTGLMLSNDATTPNTTFDIAYGNVMSDDGVTVIAQPYAFSKTTSAWTQGSSLGALDTGTVAASTAYAVFEIANTTSGIVDNLMSLSTTSPDLPAGYAKKSLPIGFIHTDGNAHIKSFTATNEAPGVDRYVFGTTTTSPLDISTSSLGTGATAYTLGSVPIGVQVKPIVRASMTNATTVPAAVLISSLDETDLAPTTTSPFSAVPGYSLLVTTTPGNISNATITGLMTSNAGQIRARSSQASTTLALQTIGYEYCKSCQYHPTGNLLIDGTGMSALTGTTTATITLSTNAGGERVYVHAIDNSISSVSDSTGATWAENRGFPYNPGTYEQDDWISSTTTGALSNDVISITYNTTNTTQAYAVALAGALTTTGFDPNTAIPAGTNSACCGHTNISTTFSTTKPRDIIINFQAEFQGSGVPPPTISGYNQLFPPVYWANNFGDTIFVASFGFSSVPLTGATATYTFQGGLGNYGTMTTIAVPASGQ